VLRRGWANPSHAAGGGDWRGVINIRTIAPTTSSRATEGRRGGVAKFGGWNAWPTEMGYPGEDVGGEGS